MAALNHQNLVKCLASFTFHEALYMIYPLAEGNLEEFMVSNKSLSADYDVDSTEVWLTEQLRGLAGALLVIHNQEDGPREQSYLGVKGADSRRTGYIHDIKPENILVVPRDGKWPLFRLSDFSCAKVADFVASISGQLGTHATLSKAGTPNYRPPESQSGKTSRPYDLWSLGCVYLELLTWCLEGYEALEEFREARQGLVCPGKHEDGGFYFMEEAGDKKKWRLRPAVNEKLASLRLKCYGPLKEILDVLPSLFQINPKQRPTAAELASTLKAF